MTQVHAITPDLVAAYWLCKRKAFSLLRGDTGDPHEYVHVIEARAANTLYAYLCSLKVGDIHVYQGHDEAMATDAHVLTDVTLRSGYLEATADALKRISSGPSRKKPHYEPHLALGTYAITKEHKIRLAFVGYVLAEAHRYPPTNGTIVNVAGTVARIQLPRLMADLVPIVDVLNAWKTNLPSDPPPIILNDHCLLCPFRVIVHPFFPEVKRVISLHVDIEPKLYQSRSSLARSMSSDCLNKEFKRVTFLQPTSSCNG